VFGQRDWSSSMAALGSWASVYFGKHEPLDSQQLFLYFQGSKFCLGANWEDIRQGVEAYNDEVQGRLFCPEEARKRRRDLFHQASHLPWVSNQSELSFWRLGSLFATF
jgi:hypothetical protein